MAPPLSAVVSEMHSGKRGSNVKGTKTGWLCIVLCVHMQLTLGELSKGTARLLVDVLGP